jgi:hypothetical protein
MRNRYQDAHAPDAIRRRPRMCAGKSGVSRRSRKWRMRHREPGPPWGSIRLLGCARGDHRDRRNVAGATFVPTL